MKKLILLTIAIITIMASSSFAYELNSIQGTTANFSIMGYVVTVNYTSSANPKEATANTQEGDVLVDPIYGFDLVLESVTNNGIEPTWTATYNYIVRNVGNVAAGSTFNIVTDNAEYIGTANWTVEKSDFVTLGVFATTNVLVSHNALATAKPYDEVSMNIELQELDGTMTPRTDPEYYTGFNNNRYGGFMSTSQVVKSWIEIADIYVTKSYSITIDDPSMDDGVPIPGATIKYTITYENRGSASGNGVVLTDWIPVDHTDFAMSSTQNESLGDAVTVAYSFSSTTDPFVFSYVPSGNSPQGLLNPTVNVNSTVDPSIRGIRFTLSDVAEGVRGTINYSVIIE